ncbi:MAG: N-formylglutamate amidohydrolase, partial [Bauldia sp.]
MAWRGDRTAETEAEGGDIAPFVAIDGDPALGLVLVCDHASNRIPHGYGCLGLEADALARHIAYDPGAAAVTRALARRLGAPAVLSTFSRLVIDPNRGEDDPTLIMRLSDRAVVPGNRDVDDGERARRIAAWYAPYHAAID